MRQIIMFFIFTLGLAALGQAGPIPDFSKITLSAPDTQAIPPLLVAANQAGGAEAAEDQPMGQGRIDAKVLGRKGGYLHPFVSLSASYSDNVYNTRNNTQSDSSYILSPGLWLALPGTREKLPAINTSTTTPGGLVMARDQTDFFRRYQAYLYYNADIIRYDDLTSEDAEDHRVEGLFQYNLKGGLSLDLVGQFISSHDSRGTGITTAADTLDKYDNSLVNLTLSYKINDTFRLRGDYANFEVDYDKVGNRVRDRVDNSFSAYLFAQVMPKTSLFAEYEHVDVDYDIDTLSDSKVNRFYGGVKWEITAKSRGRFKVGYGQKEFARASISDADNMITELSLYHSFTTSTSINLVATRKINETTISTSNFTRNNSLSATYIQRFTSKITGNLGLSYNYDEYDGALTYGGETKERDDKLYAISPALNYAFTDRLSLDLSYSRSERDSNFADFDYTNNTLFVRLTGAL